MASAEDELNADQICSDREIKLLSKVVTVAEKAGKHIERRFDLQLHSRHIAEVLEDVHCEVASKEDARPAR
jgi:hypothetical protein